MTPEGAIKHGICQWLWAKGIFFWVQSAGRIPGRKANSRYQRNGIADILGCYRGRMLAIEVKAPKGKTTAEQDEFLAAVNGFGGIAFVARSIADVERELGKVSP